MGNCASSKYAVDEDKAPKKVKLNKKQKKALENEKANGTVVEPVLENKDDDNTEPKAPVAEVEAEVKTDNEKIDFIDENTAKCNESTTTETKLDDNQKKEVTTYQTTVVKHTQKEGDELMSHLKNEAFRTLQNLLKKQDNDGDKSTTVKSTTASSNNNDPETAKISENEDVVEQIKAQALVSLGETQKDKVNSIVDFGTNLIKDGSVKDMNELLSNLEKEYKDDTELVGKVVNSTVGFLTAKGTEAGSLLSNILANVSTGLQGVMNETEKTTVKVTRTVTEQIMSGGQLKEVTRVITSDQPMANPGDSSNNIEDVLKNLQNGLNVDGTTFQTSTTMVGQPEITRTKVVNSGTTEMSSNHTEKHENVHESSVKESSLKETSSEDTVTRSQAEKVVSTAVNAAVEQLNDSKTESGTLIVENGVHTVEETDLNEHVTEENIKIEEESSIKTSTTKIVLNGNESVSEQIEKAQSEFFSEGKKEAEQSISKLALNGGKEHVTESSSESKLEEKSQKESAESSNTVTIAESVLSN